MTPLETFNLLSTLLSPLSDDQALHKWQLNTLNQQDWISLVKRASGHLVTPSLYCMFRNKGLLPQLPEDLKEYLESVYYLNLVRNQAIRNQALEVVSIMNQVGIEPILLKGIGSLLTNLYPDLGMRVLSDIDILIPAEQLAEAETALCEHGYYRVPEFDVHAFDTCHHSCPLIKQGSTTKIELHRRLVSTALRHELLNNKNHWQSAQAVNIGNLHCFVLSPETRLLHNFYHTQIQDRNFKNSTIQLRQLLEWLWLRHTYDQHINWIEFLNEVKQQGLTTPFTAYLLNAKINFGQALPCNVKPTTAAYLQITWEQQLKRYPILHRSIRVLRYCLHGMRYFFSKSTIQHRYNNVSLIRGWYLRLGDFFSPNWYQTRWRIIKQLTGF